MRDTGPILKERKKNSQECGGGLEKKARGLGGGLERKSLHKVIVRKEASGRKPEVKYKNFSLISALGGKRYIQFSVMPFPKFLLCFFVCLFVCFYFSVFLALLFIFM